MHGVLGTARAELVDRGEFELKGIDAPWRLYEVPVVGRARQRRARRLGALAVRRARPRSASCSPISSTRAVGGRGGMVLVTGEAGVGKSRLIQEAADRRARAGHGACSSGHCLDMDAPPPYQPLVEQLEQAARALAPEVFREVLGENAPEVARLMPELHRIYDDIGESPDAPARPGAPLPAARVRAFVERAALRRPLCSASRICTGPTSRACC